MSGWLIAGLLAFVGWTILACRVGWMAHAYTRVGEGERLDRATWGWVCGRYCDEGDGRRADWLPPDRYAGEGNTGTTGGATIARP